MSFLLDVADPSIHFHARKCNKTTTNSASASPVANNTANNTPIIGPIAANPFTSANKSHFLLAPSSSHSPSATSLFYSNCPSPVPGVAARSGMNSGVDSPASTFLSGFSAATRKSAQGMIASCPSSPSFGARSLSSKPLSHNNLNSCRTTSSGTSGHQYHPASKSHLSMSMTPLSGSPPPTTSSLMAQARPILKSSRSHPGHGSIASSPVQDHQIPSMLLSTSPPMIKIQETQQQRQQQQGDSKPQRSHSSSAVPTKSTTQPTISDTVSSQHHCSTASIPGGAAPKSPMMPSSATSTGTTTTAAAAAGRLAPPTTSTTALSTSKNSPPTSPWMIPSNCDDDQMNKLVSFQL